MDFVAHVGGKWGVVTSLVVFFYKENSEKIGKQNCGKRRKTSVLLRSFLFKRFIVLNVL